jgi:hypothetical protein
LITSCRQYAAYPKGSLRNIPEIRCCSDSSFIHSQARSLVASLATETGFLSRSLHCYVRRDDFMCTQNPEDVVDFQVFGVIPGKVFLHSFQSSDWQHAQQLGEMRGVRWIRH